VGATPAVVKGTTLAHWPVKTYTDNFPTTLDETHHRLFVGCRIPARLLVFDTESGRTVATLEAGSSDAGRFEVNCGASMRVIGLCCFAASVPSDLRSAKVCPGRAQPAIRSPLSEVAAECRAGHQQSAQ
jgi:hypothetical protein